MPGIDLKHIEFTTFSLHPCCTPSFMTKPLLSCFEPIVFYQHLLAHLANVHIPIPIPMPNLFSSQGLGPSPMHQVSARGQSLQCNPINYKYQ